MLKNIKQDLLNQNNLGRYLRYAVGEVILIVIGILVAVSINNWNEERQQKKVVDAIFAVLVNDIKQDTAEVSRILDFYNGKKSTFLKIVRDSIPRNEISKCDLCPTLISSYELFSINRRGIYQINEYYNHTLSDQDTLVFHIVNFYSSLTEEIERMDGMIEADIAGNLTHWRDNYPWFAASMNKEIRPEHWTYFGSQEYKNKVAFHYVLIYENYLSYLEAFQKNSERILKALSERLRDNQ